MRGTHVVAFAFAAALALTRTVHAWTDARPAGLVTELAVDRDGGATVTLRVHWRILAGRFHTFDINQLPLDLTLVEASASDTTGIAVPVATRVPAPGALEVTLGEESGLRRGAIDVVLRYTTSLRATIHRVGDDAVIDVTTAPWERGLEAAEMRIALPSSARRAQWIADDSPGVDTTVTSELGRDVVHAIRRHLAAGARWTGHVACDPALFAWLDRPHVAVQPARQAARRETTPAMLSAVGLSFLCMMAAFALSRRRGTRLVPLPPALQWVPYVAAAMAGALQGAASLGASGAVTGGVLIAIAAFACFVPGLQRPSAGDHDHAWRLWSADQTRELAGSRRASSGRWLTRTFVVAAAVMIGVAVRRHYAIASIIAVDFAAIAVASIAVYRRVMPRSDAALLAPWARPLAHKLRLGAAGRLVWRVQGAGALPGSVVMRVVPRRGYRLVNGMRSIDCVVHWRAGTLRWHACVALEIRTERACHAEAALRRVADRESAIECTLGQDEARFVGELCGPDARTVMRAVASTMPELIVAASTTNATSAARASAETAPEACAAASTPLVHQPA